MTQFSSDELGKIVEPENDVAADELSTWLDVTLTLAESPPQTAESPGDATVNQMLAVYECFELLHRVWPAETEADDETDVPRSKIGPWTLIRKIGQGGMGAVWEARQEQPIQRRLAIKLMNSRAGTDAVVKRFEAERNVLAMMNHPNIARIVDAGMTDDGQLYFAMDLVDGPDLRTYCNDQQVSFRQRLCLFLDICAAVEHAHQKGVIHRDLKPANILVESANGHPVVKVIDFGLARVLRRNELSLQVDETRAGEILGSLWYMSPEQAASNGRQVDTRTDVYLLGVILYQLLSDRVPLDKAKLESAPLAEILLAIQHDEPQRPSQRLLSQLPAPSITKTPEEWNELIKCLNGDLDWIVMRAIEKDPDRRYANVSELAADVRRFLQDEPVAARPPSRWYSLKKYCRKNRLIVVTGAILAAAILMGSMTATWGYLRVSAANQTAQARLEQLQKSNRILADIFSDLDLDSLEAGNQPLRMLLAQRMIAAAGQLDAELTDDPVEVAKLRYKLGKTLNSLGFHKEAVPICQGAFSFASSHRGLGLLSRDTGRELATACLNSGDFEQALATLQPILSDCLSEFGDAHAETLETQHALGEYHFIAGDYEGAVVKFREAMKGRESVLGVDDLSTQKSKFALATTFVAMKQGTKAVPIMKECVQQYRTKLPTGHPTTLRAIANLAWAYGQTSEREKGVALADEAWQLARQTFGEQHETTYNALVQVGLTAFSIDQPQRARETLERAVTGLQSTQSRENRSTIIASQVLSRIYRQTGELHLAVPILETNLRIKQKKHPADHRTVLDAIEELATLHNDLGDFELSRSMLEQARSANRLSTKADLLITSRIGQTYYDEGKFSQAVSAFTQVQRGLEAEAGRFDFDTMLAYADLAKAMSANGQSQSAVELLKPYLKELGQQGSEQRIPQMIVTAQLGIVMSHTDQLDAGIELMESVVDSGRRLKKFDYLIKELRLAYMRANESQKLQQSIDKELHFYRRQLSADSKLMGIRLLDLSRDLIAFERFAQAIILLDESIGILEKQAPQSWVFWIARFHQQRAKLHQAVDAPGSNETKAIIAALDECYQRLTDWNDEVFPAERRQLAGSIKHVVDSLSQLSLPEEAQRWQRRLEDL